MIICLFFTTIAAVRKLQQVDFGSRLDDMSMIS